jgi:hypothetical protein
MESRAKVRRRHQRLFAWMFLLATISVSSLVGVEAVFPPSPLPLPPERSLWDLLEFDLPDPQLLAVVVALVVDVASFAGLTITTLLDWLEVRHQRSMDFMNQYPAERLVMTPEPLPPKEPTPKVAQAEKAPPQPSPF